MIEIENLSFAYKKQDILFNKLSMKLGAGNIVGLLGKNGAGKTSLLKLISGMLYPKTGTCKVFGIDSRKRLPSVLSQLYFLPEEIYAPLLKVKEFIKRYSAFYPNFSDDDFRKYLKEFEIGEGENLKQMSYGQKKKVLIAFAIATNCRLLLMDEPTNGLDIPSKSQFRKIIASSLKDDQTIIISTHQIRDLGLMIDPILILHDSRFILNMTQEEITKKVIFAKGNSVHPEAKFIYSEDYGGVNNQLIENTRGEDSIIDMELLFNALVSNKRTVEYFNN
jgi:ABC-2 type transport system ATP-binding protein